jgi:hypothetical protein
LILFYSYRILEIQFFLRTKFLFGISFICFRNFH